MPSPTFPRPPADSQILLDSRTYATLTQTIESMSQDLDILRRTSRNAASPLTIDCVWNGPGDAEPGRPAILLEQSPISSLAPEAVVASRLVTVGKPTIGGNHRMNWGVLAGSGPADSVVPVQIAGPAYCYLTIPPGKSSAKYADLDAGKITLDIGGWARVLWLGSVFGDETLGLVFLGNACQTWYGSSPLQITQGSLDVSVNTMSSFASLANHDLWKGNIPPSTRVRVDWLGHDKKWHITAWDCP